MRTAWCVPILLIASCFAAEAQFTYGMVASNLPPNAITALPVFTNGLWQGQHAVFTNANYDAHVGPGGNLAIYIKDKGGQRIGQGIGLIGLVVIKYYDADETSPEARYKGRLFQTFVDPAPPQANAASITIHARYQDDTDLEGLYVFSNNTITVMFSGRDAPKTKFPSGVCFDTGLPPSHQIPADLEQSDRVKLLKNCVLRAHVQDPVKKHYRNMEYPYYDAATLGGYIDEAVLVGHFAPRKVTLRMRKPAYWTINNYAGTCPWEGFHLIYQKGFEKGRKTRSEPLVLTIE